MSERDAVALAWAIPASWAIVVFPAVYGAMSVIHRFGLGILGAAVADLVALRTRR